MCPQRPVLEGVIAGCSKNIENEYVAMFLRMKCVFVLIVMSGIYLFLLHMKQILHFVI